MTKKHISTAIVVVICALAGCGRTAVRAGEKEFLSHPIMQFDVDPQAASATNHVLSNREGSAGGGSATAGGCGCN